MPNTNPLIEQMQQILRKPATDYGNMIWEMKYGNQGFNPEYDMDYTTAPEYIEDEEYYEDYDDFNPYSDNNIGGSIPFTEEQMNTIDPMQFAPRSNTNSAPDDYDLEAILQELHDYYLNK